MWRKLLKMAATALLCVCAMMCFALAISYAEQGTKTGCAVCSALVVIFLACALKMVDIMSSLPLQRRELEAQVSCGPDGSGTKVLTYDSSPEGAREPVLGMLELPDEMLKGLRIGDIVRVTITTTGERILWPYKVEESSDE